MGLFKIEPGLFIWTWITFGLLLLLLYKFVFPSLMEGIKQREKKIADSVDKAQEIENRLASMDSEYKKIIDKAAKDADSIMRKVREDAELLKKQLSAKARSEADLIIEEARNKIKAEREAALESMKIEIADFVCETAGKLAGRSLSGEQEKQWTLEQVDKL